MCRALDLNQVVVQSVEPFVQHELVLRDPFVQWSEARRIQSVKSPTSHRTTLDQADLVEDSKMFGDLWLGDCEIVNDCPDRHLTTNQHVKDRATVCVGDRVEDVGSRGRTNDVTIICLNRNMSSASMFGRAGQIRTSVIGSASLQWMMTELLRRASDTKLYNTGTENVQYKHGQNLGEQGSRKTV